MAGEALRQLVAAVRTFAQRVIHGFHPPGGVTAPIYGSRGEVLKLVRMPDYSAS